MAPEQVAGRPVSSATDVFALAHLVAYAATGHTVFGDGHFSALVYRIANEEPYLDDCPAALRPLLARCLAKNPAARPDLTEVIEFARQALSGQTFNLVGASWLPEPVASNLPAYDSAGAVPVGAAAASPGYPRQSTRPCGDPGTRRTTRAGPSSSRDFQGRRCPTGPPAHAALGRASAVC